MKEYVVKPDSKYKGITTNVCELPVGTDNSNEAKNKRVLNNLKIYLLDINKEMTDVWKRFFKDIPNIEIHNSDFNSFMKAHEDIEGIVSPANSFGLMDGGYDKAIIDYLGPQAQSNVLTMLNLIYYGEQPVGTCLAVPFWKYTILHTPTMRTPGKILDRTVIYFCMRSVLLTCIKANIKSVVIPAFGGCTGQMDKREIANMMRLAYEQITNRPKEMDWNSILRFENYEVTQHSHAEGYNVNSLNPNFTVYHEEYKIYSLEGETHTIA